MTFVGKILVIVIMAFALLFLGISTVVFTTHTNWKEATAKEKKKVDELGKKSSDLTAAVDAAKKQLNDATEAHKQEVAQAATRIKTLEDETKQLQNDVTATRSKLEVAQQSAG